MFRYSVIVVSGSLPVQAFVWGGGLYLTLEQGEKLSYFVLTILPCLSTSRITGAGIKLASAIENQHNHLSHLHPFLVLNFCECDPFVSHPFSFIL